MSNRGQHIVQRTLFLMKAGKARSWSHAMELAAKAERDTAAPEGESLQRTVEG